MRNSIFLSAVYYVTFGTVAAFANCVDYTERGMAPIVEICAFGECEQTFQTAYCASTSFVMRGFANGLNIESHFDEETETSHVTISRDEETISAEDFENYSCKPLVSEYYLETDEGFEADFACGGFQTVLYPSDNWDEI